MEIVVLPPFLINSSLLSFLMLHSIIYRTETWPSLVLKNNYSFSYSIVSQVIHIEYQKIDRVQNVMYSNSFSICIPYHVNHDILKFQLHL